MILLSCPFTSFHRVRVKIEVDWRKEIEIDWRKEIDKD